MGSTGYRYSSTSFQHWKGMSSPFSLPHDRMDAYKASIISGFVASPPLVGNTTFSFILLSFYSPSVSTVLPSSLILDSDMTAPQCWPVIWCWWIAVFFSSTLIFLLPLSLMLYCFPWIETGNENGITSDVLGASLAFLWNHNLEPKLLSQDSTN